MNELERAIAWFESHRKSYGNARATAISNGARESTIMSVDDMIASIELAITALREQAERENGCDWCTPEPGETLELRCWRHGCTKRAAYTTAGSVEGVPVFCPMCGKKMEESK